MWCRRRSWFCLLTPDHGHGEVIVSEIASSLSLLAMTEEKEYLAMTLSIVIARVVCLFPEAVSEKLLGKVKKDVSGNFEIRF